MKREAQLEGATCHTVVSTHWTLIPDDLLAGAHSEHPTALAHCTE